MDSPSHVDSYEIFHDVLARVILDYVTVQDAERARAKPSSCGAGQGARPPTVLHQRRPRGWPCPRITLVWFRLVARERGKTRDRACPTFGSRGEKAGPARPNRGRKGGAGRLAQRSEAEAKNQTRLAQSAEEKERDKARRANSLELAAQAIALQRDQFDLALW